MPFLALTSSIAADRPSTHCIDREPKVLRRIKPQIPDIVWQQGDFGSTIVTVVLDAKGVPKRFLIYKSSGYVVLDQLAIDAAHKSTYASATHRCHDVPSNLLFQVDYPGDIGR